MKKIKRIEFKMYRKDVHSSSLTSASCLFFSVFLCVADRAHSLTGKGWKGWGWSQIIRQWESLVLYKSFSTLWVIVFQKITLTSKLILPGTDSWQCHPCSKISENFTNHCFSSRQSEELLSNRPCYRRGLPGQLWLQHQCRALLQATAQAKATAKKGGHHVQQEAKYINALIKEKVNFPHIKGNSEWSSCKVIYG